MNLSTDLIIPVIESHASLAKEEDRKWIISLYPKTLEWTMNDMKDTISIFQKLEYKEDIYDEEMDVCNDAEGAMLRINGIYNISRYCQYENPESAEGKWYKYSHIEDTESKKIPDMFSLKVVSKVIEERELEEKNGPQAWNIMMKTYAIMKRITYTDTETGVKYMICMTKRSVSPAQNMIQSGVSGLPLKVEYSLMCPPEMEAKEVVVSIVRMLQIIEQNSSPITNDQRKSVLQSYNSLIEKVRDKRIFKEDYYLAPKPMTLEQIHLSDPGITYGQITILNGYAVTDKADGERMLLYVDENGYAHLINSAFEVRGTGLRAKRDILYNTLLDGEYLMPNKRLDGVERDLFAVFDVYFVGGESVMGLPLVYTGKVEPIVKKESVKETVKETTKTSTKKETTSAKITGKSRMDIMNSIMEGSLWEHDKDASVELIAKQHIAASGMDMFAACRKILENATKRGARYDIDGLVFTPTDLPVMGYYPNKPVMLKTVSSTWDRVLKWKPPEQNSIDFSVTVYKNPVKELTMRANYAKVKLSSGYSALKNEEISVRRGLELLQTRFSERNLKDDYVLKEFTPQYKYEIGIQYAYVPYMPDGTIRAENGDEIVDGSIVEFYYDISEKRPISYRWKPMRVRNDKMRNTITPTTDVQTKKGRHNIKTIKANDWKTATSIWKSIHEPVTKEMITGLQKAPQLLKEAMNLQVRLLGSDAVYYGRNVTREHLLSVEMLNFHNSVIKDSLYKWPIDIPKQNLLELACGMAGDMNRWNDTRTGFAFRNVLGVDLVRDNITKAVDGAYARVLKPRYYREDEKRIYQNHVFVIGDCAKSLHNGASSKGLDRDSEDVLLELYGKTARRRFLTTIPPFAKNGFDMVSCQFAIHYFFETEEKLKGFMANIRDNLRHGGVFITTFMDGNTVEKLIREKGKNGLVEGRKLDGKVVVWAIRRIRLNTSGDEIPEEEAEDNISEIEETPEANELEEIQPEETVGGAPTRRGTKIVIYDPINNDEKEAKLINVPADGNCMFISLELAAFGEEKSETRDGIWMRNKIIEKMREILSTDTAEAKELYENIKLNIDNLSPDVKEEASKNISEDLYLASSSDFSSSSSADDDTKPYVERVNGYLKWMSQKKIWGTQIELRVASDLLERPVYVYQTDKKIKKAKAFTIGETKYPNKTPVMVWYNGIDHYKVIIENEKVPKKSAVPTEEAFPVSKPPAISVIPLAVKMQTSPVKEEKARFGRIIDVYLENTNRLIPEYLVDFNILQKYADQYGLELVHDGMFSDTYQAFKTKNPDAFPEFDKDLVQQQFSFLNRWAVFRRKPQGFM